MDWTWPFTQNVNNKSTLGLLVPVPVHVPGYRRGQNNEVEGWDHSYLPSTLRYNRCETLQKANPGLSSTAEKPLLGAYNSCVRNKDPPWTSALAEDHKVQEWADKDDIRWDFHSLTTPPLPG